MQFDLTIPPVRTWDRKGAVAFCRVAGRYGEHSNMNRHFPYEDAGLSWLGTEAQYQAMRFPHLPDHQEAIRHAPTLMASKYVAYERKNETRPDWQDVKVHAMAYVLTRKLDASNYGQLLIQTGECPIIEISTRDDFWGAKPHGNKLVGRNMLGVLQMQLRSGARINILPSGTAFPVPSSETRSAPQASQLGFESFDSPDGAAPSRRRFIQ